jgi:pyruvate dehydrogenase E1 component beta subunit
MREMTMIQAIRDALFTALSTDPSVLILGEDVGRNGGVFRATDGLWQEFGEERVIDTPLAESGIIGASLGLALNGLKPIAEIQFLSFIYPAFEQIVSHAARFRTRSQGAFPLQLVIRAPYGGGIRAPELHCDSSETFFIHTPGLKVVVPSSPQDAKGLLLASLEDPDPVIFLEPMKLYRANKEEVPSGWYTTPLSKAKIVEDGEDLTLLAWGAMVPLAQEVVSMWRKRGVRIELVDLRTLYPFDEDTLLKSVEKTGRVVIVQEAPRTLGFAAELIAWIQENAFYHLQVPIQRVTSFDVPVPMYALEDAFRPNTVRLSQAIQTVLTD